MRRVRIHAEDRFCIRVHGSSLGDVHRCVHAERDLGESETCARVDHTRVDRQSFPIYAFGSLFIAGFILLLGRPQWLLIFLLIIPLQLWRAGKEARVLEAKFGEEYRAYKARTWM